MFGKTAMSGICLAVIVTSMMFAPCESSATDAPVVTRIQVSGQFKASNSKPRGVSGMACLGKAADASRECFVINDEERFGEIVTLARDGIAVTGKTIEFVVKGEAGKGVRGEARDPNC